MFNRQTSTTTLLLALAFAATVVSVPHGKIALHVSSLRVIDEVLYKLQGASNHAFPSLVRAQMTLTSTRIPPSPV